MKRVSQQVSIRPGVSLPTDCLLASSDGQDVYVLLEDPSDSSSAVEEESSSSSQDQQVIQIDEPQSEKKLYIVTRPGTPQNVYIVSTDMNEALQSVQFGSQDDAFGGEVTYLSSVAEEGKKKVILKKKEAGKPAQGKPLLAAQPQAKPQAPKPQPQPKLPLILQSQHKPQPKPQPLQAKPQPVQLVQAKPQPPPQPKQPAAAKPQPVQTKQLVLQQKPQQHLILQPKSPIPKGLVQVKIQPKPEQPKPQMATVSTNTDPRPKTESHMIQTDLTLDISAAILTPAAHSVLLAEMEKLREENATLKRERDVYKSQSLLQHMRGDDGEERLKQIHERRRKLVANIQVKAGEPAAADESDKGEGSKSEETSPRRRTRKRADTRILDAVSLGPVRKMQEIKAKAEADAAKRPRRTRRLPARFRGGDVSVDIKEEEEEEKTEETEEKEAEDEEMMSEEEEEIKNREMQLTLHRGPYKCDVCNRSFRYPQELRAHEQFHEIQESTKRHDCNECGKSFSHRGGLWEHMKSHKGEVTMCEVCGKTFAREREMRKHEQRHESEVDNVSCWVCGQKCTPTYLHMHMNKHDKDRPYVCDMCNQAFAAKGALDTHKHMEHGWVNPSTSSAKDEQSMTCGTCGKKFQRRHELLQHRKAHEDLRPFTCKVCAASFKSSPALRLHQQLHTGKQFQCTLCPKAYLARGGLEIHMRTHTGEKPFSCQFCEKSFYHSGHLTEHTRLHTGERPYQCSQCDRSFPNVGNLYKHMRSVHKSQDPKQEILMQALAKGRLAAAELAASEGDAISERQATTLLDSQGGLSAAIVEKTATNGSPQDSGTKSDPPVVRKKKTSDAGPTVTDNHSIPDPVAKDDDAVATDTFGEISFNE